MNMESEGTHKLGSRGILYFNAYFVNVLLCAPCKCVILLFYVYLYHIFCVKHMQKESINCFPTHEKIARVREIGTNAYLEKLASRGTQVDTMDIFQVAKLFKNISTKFLIIYWW